MGLLTGNTLFRAALIGIGYWLSVTLAIELVNPVAKIALFWPANAIAAAGLILGRRRDWPLYLVVVAIAYFAGRVPSGHFPLYVYGGLCAANLAEVLIIAITVKTFFPLGTPHTRMSHLLPTAILSAIPACIFSGIIGGAFVASALADATFWTAFVTWLTGDLSGMSLTLPALLAWLAPQRPPLGSRSTGQVFEAVAIATGFAAVGAFVFHGIETDAWISTMFPYFVFPFLGWAALRLGLRGATAAILAVGLFAVWLTYAGHGPFDFRGLSAFSEVVLMKAGLITLALTTVFLAVVMADRHQSEQILKESFERDRRIFESIPFGVSVVPARDPNRRLFVNQRFVDMLGARSPEQVLAMPVSESYADVRDMILTMPYGEGEGLVTTAEMMRVKLDGTRWWCRVHRRRTEFEGQDAIVIWHEDVTDRKKSEDMLRAVAKGVSGAIGDDFFDILVEYLARTLEMDFAFLGSIAGEDKSRIEIIALHAKGEPGEPFAYDLAGTPCENVHGQAACVYPEGVQERFPEDTLLRRMGVEGYVGAPLFDSAGDPLGIIAVLDSKPLEFPETALTLLEIFAARAGAEIERARTETRIRQLAGAIDELSEIFALYDADDRIVMCNKGYRELNQAIADTLEPGVPFEVQARQMVETGLIDVPENEREEWLRRRVERHRDPGEPFEVKRASGQWYLVREERLPGGATATHGMEITEIKRAEDALRASEARFKDIAEATSDWIWEMDADLRFTYFSNRMERILGLPNTVNIGMTRWEIAGADPEVDEKWRDHKSILDARRPFRDFQYDRTGGDGNRTITINVSGNPIFDAHGRFTGYRGTANDITEKTRTEKALQSAQLRFRTVVDNLPAVVNLKDRDRRFIFINKLYREWYGIEEKDVLGKRAEDILIEGDDIDRNRLRQEMEVLTAGKVATREETKTGPDGKIRHVELIKFPIVGTDDDSAVLGTIEIDVTERRKAEESLRRALIAAEDANQAKSDFLATMSHEFRTPLNAILGFADIIESQYMGPVGDGKYLEYAGDIRTSGMHLLTLVNDLLDLSAIEAGKRPLINEFLDVGEIVGECVKSVMPRAADTGVNLSVDVPEDIPPLCADRRAVRQILLNVISNAVKFTDAGGNVAVSASGTGSETVFTVDDTGIGIPLDKLSSLTEPFAQIETDPYRTRDGWGLGLTITQSLVDLHGGKLDIESTPGKGTSVKVILPSLDAAETPLSQQA